MTQEDNYIGLLLEDIQSKLEGVAEAVSDLNNKADRTGQRLDKIEENTNLISAVQVAIKEQTAEINDHEVRISELEAAQKLVPN